MEKAWCRDPRSSSRVVWTALLACERAGTDFRAPMDKGASGYLLCYMRTRIAVSQKWALDAVALDWWLHLDFFWVRRQTVSYDVREIPGLLMIPKTPPP